MKTAGRKTGIMGRFLTGVFSMLIMAVAAVILATGTGPASVRAAEDQTGTITIHKFNRQSFENLKESIGEEAAKGDIPSDAEAVEGITFTLQRLADSKSEITVNSELDKNFAEQTGVTDKEGKTAFSKLPRGFYLVKEKVPDGYIAQKQAFIVKMPIKIVDAENDKVTYNYDIHVYPKDSAVALTKVVSSNEKVVGVGSEVEWTITYAVDSSALKATNGDGTTVYAKDFHITDQMDSRLDYTEKTAVFTAYDKDKKPVGTVSLTEGRDYTEEYDKTKHLVTWAYTEAGVKTLAESGVAGVQVVIKSKVNESARDSATYVWNNARIDFTNAQGDPFHIEIFDPEKDPAGAGENVPKAYLGSITIDKYDEKSKKKLSGAVFKIAASREDAEKGQFIQTEKDGKYGDYTITSDKNGAAKFSALATGEYYIKEVIAPKGYPDVSEDEPFKVTVGNTKEQANAVIAIPNICEDKDIDQTIIINDQNIEIDQGDDNNKATIEDVTTGDNNNNNNNNGGGYPGTSSTGYQSVIQYVKTGDYTKLWPWIALLVAAGIVIAVVGKKKKKKTPDR